MARTMLTTSDNPYNPFTQYDEWAAYDEKVCGYYSSSYLDRIAVTSREFSGPDNERAIEDAIDEIIKMNLPIVNPVTNERVHYVKFVEK